MVPFSKQLLPKTALFFSVVLHIRRWNISVCMDSEAVLGWQKMVTVRSFFLIFLQISDTFSFMWTCTAFASPLWLHIPYPYCSMKAVNKIQSLQTGNTNQGKWLFSLCICYIILYSLTCLPLLNQQKQFTLCFDMCVWVSIFIQFLYCKYVVLSLLQCTVEVLKADGDEQQMQC